eukprot:TRINITY_DN3078_c0_g1_i1.p1 TRINITY_DN3078_c0_g1~~TRINITY_DN3078_c0_g1_i1.p1  ORF type:complete len:357 (-),score=53.08 TRINITY_DN3078_c0_g1_i1:1047-2084(-)
MASLQIGLEDSDVVKQELLDQATLFRCIDSGNVGGLRSLLSNRKVDVNGYNAEGLTALHLAVCKYDSGRNLQIAETLLQQGANVCIKAAPPPFAQKVTLSRLDSKNPNPTAVHETQKVVLGHKTALLLALDLKSALYLKGWDYRHWDPMLRLLAESTVGFYAHEGFVEPPVLSLSSPEMVQHNWVLLSLSGNHELVELRAEGKDIPVLKLLLTGASKVLKLNFEQSSRLEIKDTSLSVVKAIVHFLYTGIVSSEFMERRGIDLLAAAHKHGVTSLQKVCESHIQPTQENWIKLLSVATECQSDTLVLKCANSIKNVMESRKESSHILKKSFSSDISGPHQLFSNT